MNRILGTTTTLDQHIVELANGGDAYRPANCPHCRSGGLWRHGCYYRKADRSTDASESRNPVAILRFLCRACLRTCSRLPACIAPRRWYDWARQQVVLLLLLAGGSLHQGCRETGRARSTLRRCSNVAFIIMGYSFVFWCWLVWYLLLCPLWPSISGNRLARAHWRAQD